MQEIKTEIVDAEIVYQQDKAQIDMQISTAKKYPRNIVKSTENSIAIVTMDTKTAQSCNYSVPRGGKTISGPSVHLARILAQNWGNLRVEAKVTSIEQTQVVSEAVAYDLENNYAVKIEVRKSITGKNGRFQDDMITVTGNAANATAFRNAIFNVIPREVTDKVHQAAKNFVTGDLSDKEKLTNKRIKVLKQLKDGYNVNEKDVLETLGKASVVNISSDDIVTIIGIMQAIQDGDSTIDLSFRSHKIKFEDKKERLKKKKEALKKKGTKPKLP